MPYCSRAKPRGDGRVQEQRCMNRFNGPIVCLSRVSLLLTFLRVAVTGLTKKTCDFHTGDAEREREGHGVPDGTETDQVQ